MDQQYEEKILGFRIYDTLRRNLYAFPPPSEHPEVTIYLCGLTTYDFAHLGNMRGPVLFDVFRKFLREIGYQVRFVTNFTDIDDKVIKRANEKGEDVLKLSRKFGREYLKDMAAFGVDTADFFPKVTYHIEDIIGYIKRILDKGYAYESNGSIYFDVPKFNAERKSYGKLSGRNIDEMITEARTEFDDNKHDQLDFALWKADPGYWKSPWGVGRPGWHIECSCMSTKYLGTSFDIHSGAIDLKFPHHENEIAQAEAHSGNGTFARTWMHFEFINWKGGKLAKSGQSFAARNLFAKHDPELIRQFILSAKYRSPIEFSDERMEEVKRSRARIDNFIFDAKRMLGESIEEDRVNLKAKLSHIEFPEIEKKTFDEINIFPERFLDDLRDDFNTQSALSRIYEIINAANLLMTGNEIGSESKEIINLALTEILWAGAIFGLFRKEREELMQITEAKKLIEGEKTGDVKKTEAEKLLQERLKFKSEKKFAEADAIRKIILELGFEVRDTADGSVLKPVE